MGTVVGPVRARAQPGRACCSRTRRSGGAGPRVCPTGRGGPRWRGCAAPSSRWAPTTPPATTATSCSIRLPRLALLEGAGIDIADADHIYVTVPGAHAPPGCSMSWACLRHQRIVARPGVAIRADTVIVASYPGCTPQLSPLARPVPARPAGRARGAAVATAVHPARGAPPDPQYRGADAHAPGARLRGVRAGWSRRPPPRVRRGRGRRGRPWRGSRGPRLLHGPAPGCWSCCPRSHRKPFYMTLSGSGDLRYGYLIGRGGARRRGCPRLPVGLPHRPGRVPDGPRGDVGLTRTPRPARLRPGDARRGRRSAHPAGSILSTAACSSTCAVQPACRASANVAGNRSGGSATPWSTAAV